MTPSPERLGAAVRSLLLGTLLFVAVLRWLQLASDAHLFRYQGY